MAKFQGKQKEKVDEIKATQAHVRAHLALYGHLRIN